MERQRRKIVKKGTELHEREEEYEGYAVPEEIKKQEEEKLNKNLTKADLEAIETQVTLKG